MQLHLRRRACVALLVGVWALVASAQSVPLDRLVDRFVLNTVTSTAGDLSPDGKWLAATTGSLRGRIGIDNARFQDPTYTAPALVGVQVIDTATGRSQKVFADARQVRGFKWAPDSTRLAFFAMNSGIFEPQVWERATATLRPIALPAGKEAAENAEFEWSADGAEVWLAVRPSDWRLDARKRFDTETAATVIVHSSKEPFLAWDEVRRMAALRAYPVVHPVVHLLLLFLAPLHVPCSLQYLLRSAIQAQV